MVDVSNRREAEPTVPPLLRADARVIRHRRWSPEEIAAMVSELKA